MTLNMPKCSTTAVDLCVQEMSEPARHKVTRRRVEKMAISPLVIARSSEARGAY
jgi:hypothetical protein